MPPSLASGLTASGVCVGPHPPWYAPQGDSPPTGLRVHNSLTGQKELFIPRNGKKVLWYTCGPTVYDHCHMGHARAYLTMDIIRRIMEDYLGYQVFLQLNVTDIDDKIIKRARLNLLLEQFVREGKPFDQVKERVEEAMRQFEDKLRERLHQLETPLQGGG
eukprot:scaffold137143_cov27-Tisochrysis_lutea.AAC.3